MIDVKAKAGEGQVAKLLAASGQKTGLPYTKDNRARLYGYEKAGQILGVVGLSITAKSRGIVCDIAVDKRFRGNGIGKEMMVFIRDQHDLHYMEALVPSNCMEFFGKCGFKEADGRGEAAADLTACAWSSYG